MRVAATAAAMVATFAASCATIDRAGQDALVVATYPIHAVTTPASFTMSDVEENDASRWSIPLIFGGRLVEDTGVTLISAVDLGVSPALGVAELASNDTKRLRPLGMYKFDGLPPTYDERRARKVEGDVLDGAKAVAGVVFLLAYLYAQAMAQGTTPR